MKVRAGRDVTFPYCSRRCWKLLHMENGSMVITKFKIFSEVDMSNPSRREFLKSTVTTACSAGLTACGLSEILTASPGLRITLATPPPAPLPIKKGVLLDMLPTTLSYADRMKMARDVGFDVIQAPTTPDQHEAEEIKKAADRAGVRIDSVMNMDHWKYPLSWSDSEVGEKSLAVVTS